MHAVLTRVDVFSCHVSCCVVGKIRREEHILVRNFYTVRVETHTGREMMVDGRLSYGGIYSCAKTEYNHGTVRNPGRIKPLLASRKRASKRKQQAQALLSDVPRTVPLVNPPYESSNTQLCKVASWSP